MHSSRETKLGVPILFCLAGERANFNVDPLVTLERMDELNLEMLPVLARGDKLAGIVSRFRLVSSFVTKGASLEAREDQAMNIPFPQ